MKILFCNIGWMEFYQGQSATDKISGGGAYVKEKGMGHEVCNYSDHQGIMYGYVQPPGARSIGEGTINIDRIGGEQKEFLTNVLVVWTATRPEGGTVVVGWYKNATVFRQYQEFESAPPQHSENDLNGYWIKAKKEDAVLLPIDERTLHIPRKTKGGMGQANIWYADSPESAALLSEICAFIDGKRTSQKPEHSRTTDPEHNSKVEKAAIKKTQQYFEELGYRIESVEKDNIGWDLEATSGKAVLEIEVKGLSGPLAIGGLTPNEYDAFSKRKASYRLAIVTNALHEPNLIICRYSIEKNTWVVEGYADLEVEIEQRTSAVVKVSF